MSQAAEVPKPPDDLELKNIIEKLAQFVAKNGSDFENMTKQKQKDNPRFGFLYGGEHFHYYTYRVQVEQALARKKQIDQQPIVQQSRLQMLQSQIQESERNLKAQHDALMKQQESEINEVIRNSLEVQIMQVADELHLDLRELSTIIDELAYPYAQEGQEAAVNWILAHYLSPKHGELLVRFLLERVKDPRDYMQRKMSILCVVTRVMQISARDQNEHLTSLLRRFGPIMSCYAMHLHGKQDERARSDLEQMVRSWTQNGLFDEAVEWRCTNIEETIGEYQNELRNEYSNDVADVTQRIQTQFAQYERQNLEYARHIQQQIAAEQFQQQQAGGMMGAQTQPPPDLIAQQQQQIPPPQQRQRRSRFDDAGPSPAAQALLPAPSVVRPQSAAPSSVAASPWHQPPPGLYQPPTNIPPPMGHFQQPPPQQLQHGWVPPSQGPWMQQGPPPGQMAGQPSSMSFGPAMPPLGATQAQTTRPMVPGMLDEKALVPKVAYYDLPAGLMAPLVRMEDHDYKPLNPNELRLPPPMPPNERLLNAMEAFYAPPNHEVPRDSEGWERLGLYEYYKEKSKAGQRSKGEKLEIDEGNNGKSSSHGGGRRNESDRRNLRSDSNSPRRGGGRGRNRSSSPEERRHRRSRRSRSGSSKSRSSSGRSKSRSPERSSSRYPRDRSKERNDHGHHRSSRREDSRKYSDEEDNNPRSGFRGFSVGQQQMIRPPAPQAVQAAASFAAADPFENFRRAQSVGFNQRIRAAFQPPFKQ